MTADEFLALFPEFDDPARYPRARVEMYLTLAATRVGACAWGTSYNLGLALFAAHYLALSGGWLDQGGTGVVKAEMSSKKVGDVQVTYATTANQSMDAGWWNSTGYGRQWWDLNRLCGVAVLQLI